MVKGHLTGCGLHGYSLVSGPFNRSIKYTFLFLNNFFLFVSSVCLFVVFIFISISLNHGGLVNCA